MRESPVIFFIVLIVSLFLFGGVLGAGYILDDHSVIQNRTELRVLPGFYKSFLMPWHQNQPQQGNYRPLTLFSYTLTLSVSESTAIMRFINLIIHSANAALVFYLIRIFSSKKVAYSSSLIFSILPINAGTVVSLVGRSDLLSAFFILFSLILFFKNKFGLSALSLFLALLSKEFSIFLLPVFAFFIVFLRKDKFLEMGRILSYYILIVIPYFILRYLVLGGQALKSQSSVDPIIGPMAFLDLKDRILTGFVYFYLYIRKTFIPFDLSPDYSFNQIPVPQIYSRDFIFGLVLLLAVLIIFFKDKGRDIKIGMLLFLIPFSLISNVFLVTTGTFAERWWYFPSVGPLWIVSVFGSRFTVHRSRLIVRGLQFVVLAAVIFYLNTSFRQARIWTDERKLFVAAAENSPDSAWARANLAAIYFKEKKFDAADREARHSLSIFENYPAALNINAKLRWREGKIDEAENTFLLALENDLNKRNRRDLYRSLSILKLETKNYAEAADYIKKTINSTAFGDIEKTVYLDTLFSAYIEDLPQNKTGNLSDREINTVRALIEHIKGF